MTTILSQHSTNDISESVTIKVVPLSSRPYNPVLVAGFRKGLNLVDRLVDQAGNLPNLPKDKVVPALLTQVCGYERAATMFHNLRPDNVAKELTKRIDCIRTLADLFVSPKFTDSNRSSLDALLQLPAHFPDFLYGYRLAYGDRTVDGLDLVTRCDIDYDYEVVLKSAIRERKDAIGKLPVERRWLASRERAYRKKYHAATGLVREDFYRQFEDDYWLDDTAASDEAKSMGLTNVNGSADPASPAAYKGEHRVSYSVLSQVDHAIYKILDAIVDDKHPLQVVMRDQCPEFTYFLHETLDQAAALSARNLPELCNRPYAAYLASLARFDGAVAEAYRDGQTAQRPAFLVFPKPATYLDTKEKKQCVKLIQKLLCPDRHGEDSDMLMHLYDMTCTLESLADAYDSVTDYNDSLLNAEHNFRSLYHMPSGMVPEADYRSYVERLPQESPAASAC